MEILYERKKETFYNTNLQNKTILFTYNTVWWKNTPLPSPHTHAHTNITYNIKLYRKSCESSSIEKWMRVIESRRERNKRRMRERKEEIMKIPE